MLLAYYAFDTLLTGFADKIALHDHENGADCEIVLAPAKLTTDAQISLTENDIECIKSSCMTASSSRITFRGCMMT